MNRWNEIPGTEGITFVEFAENHNNHHHCIACGGCILDPRTLQVTPVWCIGCARRIDRNLPPGLRRPWQAKGDPGPIFWNQYNRAVQCHNCGQVFVPLEVSNGDSL